MIGRIVRPADFQRVLAAPLRSRSTHFALHYLAERPGVPVAAQAAQQARQAAHQAASTSTDSPSSQDGVLVEALEKPQSQPQLRLHSPELSTKLSTACADAVAAPALAVDEWWLGLVVPKRHAKRAVTRNLIKRQVRALMASQGAALPAGLWVLRLRAPFDRQEFLSPASDVLRASAHAELVALLDRALHSPLPPRAPRAAGAPASRSRAKR